MKSIHVALAVTTLLVSAGAASAADPLSVCASAAEAARIAPLVAKGPVGPTLSASIGKELKFNEALVVSAYPPEWRTGVGGAHFAAVWPTLVAWDRALSLVTKSGNIFEINGRIPPGEPSKRSKFFNLKPAGDGLDGHLRPDLYSAIYALDMPGREGRVLGVLFFGEGGEFVLGVFMPTEGRPPNDAELAQFETTRAAMRALPPLCPAS